jgi:anti-sigma factor RsiW
MNADRRGNDMPADEHFETADLLVPYVDGELGPDERPRVDALLEASAEARRRLEVHRRVAEALRRPSAVTSEEDTEEDWERCLVAVRGRLRRARRLWISVAAASSAAAVLAAALFLGLPWLRGPSAQELGGGTLAVDEPAPALIENLGVLEDVVQALEEEATLLTPDLVDALLGQSLQGAADPAAAEGVPPEALPLDSGVLDLLLEEELFEESL